MPEMLETVQIEDGQGGFIVINRDDFDLTKHQLFQSKTSKPATTAAIVEEPKQEEPQPVEETPDIWVATRTAVLEQLEAGEIRKIAESLGIPRPRSGGWAATIPLIVEKELEAGGV